MGHDSGQRNLLSRRQFVGALGLAGAAFAGGCSSREPAPADPSGLVALEPSRENGYLGRWISKTIDGDACKVTTAPGAFLEFDVTGTDQVEVRIDSLAESMPFYWAWQVDDGAPTREKTGTASVRLPDAGSHRVRITTDGIWEITKRWEGEEGFVLRGIDPQRGSCTPHSLEGATIAYYGDSITEGDCVLGANSLPVRDSAVHGYATLSARELGGQPYCAGYGGTGLMERGTFAPALDAVTHYSHDRIAPAFDADCVVVEYGTNDKRASAQSFARAYGRLLEKLGELHPKTPTFCMVPLSQIHAKEIRACAEKAGFHVVETRDWNISTVSDGIHPDVAGARRMAKLLAREIGSRLF